MIVLHVIGFILLGAGVIVAGVVGLCIVIAKSTAHNQATCDCVDCQQRRLRAWQKQQDKKQPVTETRDSSWLSTRQLKTEMVIDHKGFRFQITDLAFVDSGMIVSLSRIPGRRRSIVPISHDMLDRRMWHVESGRWPGQ